MSKLWRSIGGPTVGEGRISFPFTAEASEEIARAIVAGHPVAVTTIADGEGETLLLVEARTRADGVKP